MTRTSFGSVHKQVTADWSGAMKKTVAAMVASAAQPGQIIAPATIDQLAAGLPEMVHAGGRTRATFS